MRGKKAAVFCAVILICAAVLRLYLGNEKTYFHMDEAYSYGMMNEKIRDFTDRPDFLNTYHDSGYYRSYLSIDPEERGDWGPVYENQARDVHPPFYYLLLRCAAMAAGGGFTKWSGLGLNLAISLISGLVLYFLGKELAGSRACGCLACLLGSLNFMALNMSLYIRMYELASLAVLLLFLAHLRWVRKRSLWRSAAVCGTFLLGAFTHYYCLIFGASLWLMTTAECVRKRDFRGLLVYEGCVLSAAVIFLLTFPWALNPIAGNYRGIGQAASLGQLPERAELFLKILNEQLFGGMWPLWIGALLAAVLLTGRRKPLLFLGFPLLVYFGAVAWEAPYLEDRYLMPACGILSLLLTLTVFGLCRRFGTERAAFPAAGAVLAVLLLLPFLQKKELPYIYGQYRDAANQARQQHPDMVYLFDPSDDRFLDDIYLFTLSRKSFIMDSGRVSEQTLTEAMEPLGDSVWVFVSQKAELPGKGIWGWSVSGSREMNACRIYMYERDAAEGEEEHVSYSGGGR